MGDLLMKNGLKLAQCLLDDEVNKNFLASTGSSATKAQSIFQFGKFVYVKVERHTSPVSSAALTQESADFPSRRHPHLPHRKRD
jgi:hypothetical protein